MISNNETRADSTLEHPHFGPLIGSALGRLHRSDRRRRSGRHGAILHLHGSAIADLWLAFLRCGNRAMPNTESEPEREQLESSC
jgi:hypothetical protein